MALRASPPLASRKISHDISSIFVGPIVAIGTELPISRTATFRVFWVAGGFTFSDVGVPNRWCQGERPPGRPHGESHPIFVHRAPCQCPSLSLCYAPKNLN